MHRDRVRVDLEPDADRTDAIDLNEGDRAGTAGLEILNRGLVDVRHLRSLALRWRADSRSPGRRREGDPRNRLLGTVIKES
jgi:hypothetical protein